MTKAPLKPPGVWYKRLATFLWYDIIYLLYMAIMSIFTEISTSPPSISIDELERRTGQVAVITGGPRGLALGLIKRLVQMDYTIVMGVRSIDDSKKRLATFAKSNKDLSFHKIKFLEMDLTSLTSIRTFAEEVLRETTRIDLLLCNAAIMKAPYELTKDGYESQFQVNYLSNFLLTHLLLDRLKEDGGGQIIYSSSILYQYGTFNVDELEKASVYTPYKFYYPSKLYPVMSMLHLQRLLQEENAKVYLYAVHPGLVPTDLWYTGGSYLVGVFGRLAQAMFRTIENAADTILWPTLSPKFRNEGGLYLESGVPISICSHARNKEHQAILYERSLKLAGISKERSSHRVNKAK